MTTEANEPIDLGETTFYPSDGSPAYRVYLNLSGHAAEDVMERALAMFGPGTTAGGRAEAGWFEVGTIKEDGITYIPD